VSITFRKHDPSLEAALHEKYKRGKVAQHRRELTTNNELTGKKRKPEASSYAEGDEFEGRVHGSTGGAGGAGS
jgi:hypothetical protein